MYFFIHHDVIFHKRHFFPVGMQETLQQRRRFQRTAEIDALRSIHQFDGKDMFKVVHHFKKFGCGIGTHTYVDRKSTRLNSSHTDSSRMPSSA